LHGDARERAKYNDDGSHKVTTIIKVAFGDATYQRLFAVNLD
jgi:hypothetical protein